MNLSVARPRTALLVTLSLATLCIGLTLAANRDAFGEPELAPPRHVLVELFTSQG